jgi:DNA polymerase III alpha subunit
MHLWYLSFQRNPLPILQRLKCQKGFPIVQFDIMRKILVLKIDILSQRGLGTIDEAVKIIEENREE